MKLLHLLAAGGAGGIETLCKDISATDIVENHFIFVWYGGCTADEMIINGTHSTVLGHSKLSVIRSYRAISEYIVKHGIDAVIVHHEAPVLWIYLLLIGKKNKRIKTVVYIHAHLDDVLKPEKKKTHAIRKALLMYTAQRVDHVVAVSDMVKNSLINAGFDGSNIRMIHNGTDLKKYKGTKRHEYGEKTEFIYVGRLIKEKGIRNIIEAASRLDKDGIRDRIHINIVGDGAYAGELRKECRQLGLDDCITFCGRQNDIPDRLAKADFFIHLPDWEEGFGITVIEAMASGLPCVVYDRGAMRELVEDGKNGFLIDPYKDDVTATIKYIVSDMTADEYMKMSENATVTGRRFSVENCVLQIRDMLS